MLATEEADAQAEIQAEAIVDIGRGIAASMGVVVAVEVLARW
jgi:prefoldin subunit 5